MLVQTDYKHIQLNERQIPVITRVNFKVMMLVREFLFYGWSPEELKYQHPQLEMAEIHAALAYYYDHQDQLHQEMVKEDAVIERFLADNANNPLLRRRIAE